MTRFVGTPESRELSIPYCALRVHPRQAVPGHLCLELLCSSVRACPGTPHTYPALPKFLGPGVEISPWESQWVCWAAGHGAEPEGLAASLLERSPCSQQGCVLEQLTLRECWKAPPGEMKSDLWAFIWRFLCCLCAEGSLLQLGIVALSIVWMDRQE